MEEAARKSLSVAGVLRYLGLKQAGGTQAYVGGLMRKFEIDTSHFTGQAHSKGKRSRKRLRPEEILVLLSEGSHRTKGYQLKRALSDLGVEDICSECGVGSMWNGKPLVLHVDHIDGEWLDNRIENLRLLCPNCHSQTDTYCRKTQASVVE